MYKLRITEHWYFFSLKYYTSDWEMWYYYRFLHCCRSSRVLQEFCLNDLDFNFQAKIFAIKKMLNGFRIDFVLGMIAILTHPCASIGKFMYQRYFKHIFFQSAIEFKYRLLCINDRYITKTTGHQLFKICLLENPLTSLI